MEVSDVPPELMDRSGACFRYIGEKIQKESVAIETAGITIIRRGKQRTTWRGPQTMSAFPHVELTFCVS
eukprot:757718-Hanusia_phi.AAC.6